MMGATSPTFLWLLVTVVQKQTFQTMSLLQVLGRPGLLPLALADIMHIFTWHLLMALLAAAVSWRTGAISSCCLCGAPRLAACEHKHKPSAARSGLRLQSTAQLPALPLCHTESLQEMFVLVIGFPSGTCR